MGGGPDFAVLLGLTIATTTPSTKSAPMHAATMPMMEPTLRPGGFGCRHTGGAWYAGGGWRCGSTGLGGAATGTAAGLGRSRKIA